MFLLALSRQRARLLRWDLERRRPALHPHRRDRQVDALTHSAW